MDKEQIKKIIEATGAVAEMSTLFLKTALTSGATFDEALALTQVYLTILVQGPAQTNGVKPVGEDVLIVTFDNSEKDEAVLNIGRPIEGGAMRVINGFFGEDAEKLYENLTSKED